MLKIGDTVKVKGKPGKFVIWDISRDKSETLIVDPLRNGVPQHGQSITIKRSKIEGKAPSVSKKRVEQSKDGELTRLAPARLRGLLSAERKRVIAERRELLAKTRKACQRAKTMATERRKQRRAKALADLKATQMEERAELAIACAARREKIKGKAQHLTARLNALKDESERARNAKKALAARQRSPAQKLGAIRAVEKRSEQFDRIRREVPQTMLPYFEIVKNRLRSSKNKSKSEHFFEIAKADPEAVYLANAKVADDGIAEILEQGEPKWKTQHKRIEFAICERAKRSAKSRRKFALKPSEEKALRKIGVCPLRLMNECYRPTKRRVISGPALSLIASNRRKLSDQKAPF